MERRNKKLLRLFLSLVLVLCQAFSFVPVNADTAEEETVPKEKITSAHNGKDFVKGVSKLSKKYRIAADTKKGMPELSGAEGVDYGGSCVMSFKSKKDYDAALKELEKKDIDYTVDGSVGICAPVLKTANKEAKINPNAKTKICIIDTGSNIANEKVSLLEDDGSDNNGHGTSMAKLILSETNDAYIISVKAIGDNGKGRLSDVYAGVRYAIDHKADYILMAVSLKDNGDYDGFVSLVKEAVKGGIKVIASAGNNNADASGYIPAGIKGVITAGAIDSDGYKNPQSNYGKSVNYYLTADSTSEAAAKLAGLMIAGKSSGCATKYKVKNEEDGETTETSASIETTVETESEKPTDETETSETTEASETTETKESSATNDVTETNGSTGETTEEPEFEINKSKMTWPKKTDLVAAGYSSSDEFASAVIAACKAMKGAEYGTGNGQADCMRYVNLAYAQALKLISGLKVSNGKIPGVKRSNGNVTYNGTSLSKSKYHLVDGCTTWSEKSPHAMGHPGGINIDDAGGLKAALKKLGAKKGSIILFGAKSGSSEFKWTHAAIYTGTGTNVYEAPGGNYTTGVVYTKTDHGSGRKKYTYVAVFTYESFVLPKRITVVKTSSKQGLTENNDCYSLQGTKYGLYNSAGTLVHEFTLDQDGKADTFSISDQNQTYYVSEISAGRGYKVNETKYTVDPQKADSSGLITIKVEDEPVASEGKLVIEKKDPEGWDSVTGKKMAEAVFRVDYYDSVSIDGYKDLFDGDGNPKEAKATANISSFSAAQGPAVFEISAKTLSEADASGYFSKLKGLSALPLGTYVITEIKAPAGYKMADASKPLMMKIRQEGNDAVAYYTADPSEYQVLEDKIVLNEASNNGKAFFRKKITVNEDDDFEMSLYSMEGTEYAVFHKESGSLALTVVFGKDGKYREVKFPSGVKTQDIGDDGVLKLPAGEYVAKEIHSGYGLYLDNTEKTFTVNENETAEIEFSDEPVFTRFDWLIKKVRSNLSSEIVSMIDVEGAEFTLCYYAGFYDDESYKNETPSKKWVFRTDKEGKVCYDESHFVSGDKLFKNSKGEYLAPQGTYVITETKAPSGMEVSSEVKKIVVRFAKDIVKGSASDPALNFASASSVTDNSAAGFKDGSTEYYNDYKSSVSTKAVSTTSGAKELAAVKDAGITDILTYKNLLPGYQYKVRAWIVKTDGKTVVDPFDTVLKIDKGGDRSGTLSISFTVDASVLKGETLTVMEEVYIIDGDGKELLYASHADINNKEQQVVVPDIKTELIDEKIDSYTDQDNLKLLSYGKDVTLTDYVSYKNLIVGKTYKLTGTLIQKETGKQLLNSKGKAYTASVEFKCEKENGIVKVVFEHVDTTVLKGSVVACETLSAGGIDLIVHWDVNDKKQTLTSPEIKTSARDGQNNTKTLTYSETCDITDTVSYKGLTTGKKYKITGTLMNKATGKEYVDTDGKKYTASVEFTAETGSGTVEVKFKNVKISYEYTAIVVFESLREMRKDIEIAVHEDIYDNEQTVYRPYASTVASSSSGTKNITDLTGKTKISDKVMYKGFTPGNTYRATATLYKTNGTQIMNDGKPVTNSVTFTPKESDGTVKVPLTFKTDSISSGEAVVIFENIYDVATEEEISNGVQFKDIEIVRHNDLKNKDQTLKYNPTVPKTGEGTSPVMVIGLLILCSAAGPLGLALKVKRGAKYRDPQRSRRKPDGNSLSSFLKRRRQACNSRAWRNWSP